MSRHVDHIGTGIVAVMPAMMKLQKLENKNNVIDCNIKLLGLNSKNLPAKRKKTIVCRMSSDTVH